MDIKDVPSEIVKSVKSRGFNDHQISAMTADQMFDEYCNWHGLIKWGPTLRYVLDSLRDSEDNS